MSIHEVENIWNFEEGLSNAVVKLVDQIFEIDLSLLDVLLLNHVFVPEGEIIACSAGKIHVFWIGPEINQEFVEIILIEKLTLMKIPNEYRDVFPHHFKVGKPKHCYCIALSK